MPINSIFFGQDLQGAENIRTASKNTLEIIIDRDKRDLPYPTRKKLWLVNGIKPLRVGRWSTVWFEDKKVNVGNDDDPRTYPMTVRDRFYLEMATDLVNNTVYTVNSPIGIITLTYTDKGTVCTGIKVNQVGYSELGTKRFGFLSVWRGSLGTQDLGVGQIPYEVWDSSSKVFSGLSGPRLNDLEPGLSGTAHLHSGQYVYKLDLSSVPAGGPYTIVVPGYGKSYDFGIGQNYSNFINYTTFRGLFHQRCGIKLELANTPFVRAGVCHTSIQVTDSTRTWNENTYSWGWTTDNGDTARVTITGGYHDAGDFDRRLAHVVIPAYLLSLYEAFPSKFQISEFNIPESANAIPDILNEALWGIQLFENLQDLTTLNQAAQPGGVRAGIETDSNATYGEDKPDTDPRQYRTYRHHGGVTAVAAGLFAHASRLVQPFDAARASTLATEAASAWSWLQTFDHLGDDPDVGSNGYAEAFTAMKMYAALQRYLLDPTNQQKHADFTVLASQADNEHPGLGWPQQYKPYLINMDYVERGMIFSPYFMSYLIPPIGVNVDTTIQDDFKNNLIFKRADEIVANMDDPNKEIFLYGGGRPIALGMGTAQGRAADPLIYAYRLETDPVKKQNYLDHISLLADYTIGLNPWNRSWITGLGTEDPQTPLQLESYFHKNVDNPSIGNVPGITIFGPRGEGNSGATYVTQVKNEMYPDPDLMPGQMRFTDGWSWILTNEFSTWETVIQNAIMYAFLSTGAQASLP